MWFLLPLIVFSLCAWWWWTTTKKVTNLQMTRIPPQAENQLRPAKLPHDSVARYLELYTNVFRTQNLASVFSVMSDVFYHSVANTIQGFNRIGIRKEISFTPYPEEASDADPSFAFSALSGGKTDTSAASIAGDYSERYVDSTTDRVLHEKALNNYYMTAMTLRSAARDKAEKVYCTGCGMEINTAGEIFICQHCGATYRSDSFDWVMGTVATPLGQLSGDTAIKRTMYGTAIGAVVLMVLGFFAGNSTFLKILIGLGCLGIAGITVFFNHSMLQVTTAIRKVMQHDPLAAPVVIGLRALYLTKRFYNAHDHNPGDMRTMMDEKGFNAFQRLPHSGNFVVDLVAMQPTKSDFFVRNGRQYLDYTYKAALLVLTKERRMVTVERVFRVVFYRNERTRYEHMLSAQAIKCSGCGMPLDLTAQGACKFCGTEYDVADFDWKIAHVDAGAFV